MQAGLKRGLRTDRSFAHVFVAVAGFLRSIRSLPWQPAGPSQRIAQDELDLRVEAAQIVVRPALHRVEHGAVDPQEEGLPFGH